MPPVYFDVLGAILIPNTAYNTKQSIYVIIFVHVGLENHVIKLVLNTYMVNVFMGAKTVETRNTVSNAHKMIPSTPPCFALGHSKIIRIKT